jgi:hypothetical protein
MEQLHYMAAQHSEMALVSVSDMSPLRMSVDKITGNTNTFD